MSDESKEFKFDVSLKGDNPTLTILEGQAEKIVYPVKETILNTTIEGPAKYFDTVGCHYPDVLKTATVKVDGAKGVITLDLNAKDTLAATVVGALRVNRDLEAFGINSDNKKFTGEELSRLILTKSNVIDLAPIKVKEFANKFKNFSATVTKSIDKQSDDVGNILDNFIQKVTVDNLPAEVPFSAMLHIGSPKSEFTVNVGLESTGRNIVFFLYSPEYTAALHEEKEALLAEQVSEFGAKGVCVLEVF